MGAHCIFFRILQGNFLLNSSPSCFAVCGYHLSPRIALVFSLLSGVPNFSMPHSSLILISYRTSRSSLYVSHSPTMRVILYCFTTRAHLCIFFLPSITGVPLSSSWQIQVPYTKSQLRRFCVESIEPCNYFFIPMSSLNSPVFLNVPRLFHIVFLALASP